MLKYLKELDVNDRSKILRIKDFVIFRNHVVIYLYIYIYIIL
jgi:hypothetical protein